MTQEEAAVLALAVSLHRMRTPWPSPQDVAARLGLSTQAAGESLKQLRAAGLVRFVIETTHGRQGGVSTVRFVEPAAS
jgi:predicted transcriptional regulator